MEENIVEKYRDGRKKIDAEKILIDIKKKVKKYSIREKIQYQGQKLNIVVKNEIVEKDTEIQKKYIYRQ